MAIYDAMSMIVDTSERHLQFKINKDSLRHVVDDSPMAIYDRMSMIVKSSPLPTWRYDELAISVISVSRRDA